MQNNQQTSQIEIIASVFTGGTTLGIHTQTPVVSIPTCNTCSCCMYLQYLSLLFKLLSSTVLLYHLLLLLCFACFFFCIFLYHLLLLHKPALPVIAVFNRIVYFRSIHLQRLLLTNDLESRMSLANDVTVKIW